MPSFSYRSKIRAVSDHYGLNLNVQHRLDVGIASDSLYRVNKPRLPECVDVRLSSNLVVTLSGKVDGFEIPAVEIIVSSLAQHLVDYLRTNASSLGLSTISDMWIDNNDGLLKLTLTSSRQYPSKLELLPVRVLLVGLDLCYSWQISTSSVANAQPQQESHPFSQRLSLPFRTLLDNVVGRFVTWQLVKRYPFIFGQWCQQLEAEASFFSPIFSSILTIMKRSPNPVFRAKCQRLIKVLRCRHSTTISESLSNLENHLRDISEVDVSFIRVKPLSLKDEDVLWFTMERVYRDGMRRRQFKGLVGPLAADDTDDEDLSQDHTLLQHSITLDDQLSWDDPSSKPLAHVWIDPFSVRQCPDMAMDLELLDHSDQGPMNDDFWSDTHDLYFDSGDDRDLSNSQFLSGNKVDLKNAERVIPPVVFEFSDDDLFDPFQPDFKTNRPDADQDEFAESKIKYFPRDHAPNQVDGYEQVSEAVAGGAGELSWHTRTLVQNQFFSATEEPVPRQEETLLQPQNTWSDHEANLYMPLRFSIDDVEMDLVSSDTESSNPQILGSASEEHYDFEESADSWEDLSVPVGLILSEEDHSHPIPPFRVTCPSKMHQLKYQGDGEDEEPRLEQGFKSTLDWGVSADGVMHPIGDWGEDVFLVMDF
ncbi:hypothetical protein BDZ94DRAFT_1321256 [Collybia nuda]|uniref:Uncharacterized protein n=1 Tax=Collybia nuda TaxID=64659 RepID=A0A9P6CJA7_9AGAR|nr:hypothetical protein BDZ94DRAFT_1321256 [Collybia nuda]